MSDFFYSILIRPIEWLLYNILIFLFDITNSYGVSTILMSIIVSAAVTPFARKSLKFINKSKHIKKSIEPYVKKIKALDLKRSQKMDMIDAVYKEFGYNPLSEFLGLIPLLLRMPFLLGMYKVVVHNKEIFAGQSFLIISDLSRPDGILWGVNLLPILMTLFNAAAAYMMPNNTKTEFAQLIFLALVFLVLLYKSSSVLLLYWTCNNLLMLARMIWFKIVPKKIAV